MRSVIRTDIGGDHEGGVYPKKEKNVSLKFIYLLQVFSINDTRNKVKKSFSLSIKHDRRLLFFLKTHFGLHNTLMTIRRLRYEILGDFGHPYR